MPPRRASLKTIAYLAITTLTSLTLPHALAQDFPTKPLRIVVPFPAGGTTDVVARLVAQRMSESMGQQVLVDNRGGAGGTIGADIVAKAPPDGYTLLMHNITFPLSSVAQALAKRLPFDAEKDFAGVSIAVYVPFVVTAHPSVAMKDLRDLGSYLRANPKAQYNYGSTGPGSVMHVLGEAFKRDAKVDMVHIAFKGAAPLKQEVLSGRIQIGGDQLSSSLAEIRDGKLKALATTASKRLSVLPEVPTVRELGFPSIEFEGWNGLFVPAKTPQPIIARLNKEVVAAVRHPDVAKRFQDLAADPIGSSPKEQEAMLRKQMDQFRPVIKEMKLD
ncbi:MAG TPA: tripartite tricarboxylate transporter substrate binding protein [Burkholderiales bacterium]|nr:tripartite tricarboxylate transporter substrate binding protein [Burkholderiales bacterium]